MPLSSIFFLLYAKCWWSSINFFSFFFPVSVLEIQVNKRKRKKNVMKMKSNFKTVNTFLVINSKPYTIISYTNDTNDYESFNCNRNYLHYIHWEWTFAIKCIAHERNVCVRFFDDDRSSRNIDYLFRFFFSSSSEK